MKSLFLPLARIFPFTVLRPPPSEEYEESDLDYFCAYLDRLIPEGSPVYAQIKEIIELEIIKHKL